MCGYFVSFIFSRAGGGDEEDKDCRKNKFYIFLIRLYERYVRGQRTLRRLQCRRTHTAHLNEATRSRLLRELERERRYTVQDQICTLRKLNNKRIVLEIFI